MTLLILNCLKKSWLHIVKQMYLLAIGFVVVVFVLFIANSNYCTEDNLTSNGVKIEAVSDFDFSCQMNFEEEDFDRGTKMAFCCCSSSRKLMLKQPTEMAVLGIASSAQFQFKNYLNSDLAPPFQIFL